MKLHFGELENGIRLLTLEGKLDGNGIYSVESEFIRHCVGEKVRVLVDLSMVSYVSSIGIPMMVNAAKSIAGHGGKMALLNPQHNVLSVLELVGVSNIIPIYFDLESARAGMTKR